MKVILKQNIPSLGYKDDIVDVKDGYGRNYLIPQGLAVIASNAALKVLAENQRQQAHKIAAVLAEAQNAAAALEGVRPVITAKAAANGNIYGSVGPAQIAEALLKLGHEIDRKIIDLEPARQIGEHVAKIRFHKEVTAEVTFEIVAEEED